MIDPFKIYAREGFDMKFRKQGEWGNALCFFRQASDVMQDAFYEKGKNFILLAEVIVGKSFDIKGDAEKLICKSLLTPPLDEYG